MSGLIRWGIIGELQVAFWAGDPLITVVCTVMLVTIASNRGTWPFSAAAFLNGSHRLLPSLIGLVAACAGAPHGISDEGNLAVALGGAGLGRITIATALTLVAAALTWWTARTSGLSRCSLFGIFALNFAIGLGAHQLDRLLGWT